MDGINIVGILLFYFILNLIAAFCMADIADKKGYTTKSATIITFFLGIIGCLYTIALPDKKLQEQNEKIIKLLEEKNDSKEN